MNTIEVEAVVLGPLGPLSFALPAGASLGVLGVNGAGKSLLLAVLAGVVHPARGSSRTLGPAAYLPEGCPLDTTIPVRAWLQLAKRLPNHEPAFSQELVSAFELPLDRPAAQLSQGQRVRLGLILTLGRRAPIYLLDDPFLGLDPVAHKQAEGFIARRSEDATVVVAGQDADAIERLCTSLLLLDGGRVRAFGTVDEWRRRYRRVRIHGAPAAAIAQQAPHILRTEGGTLLLDDPQGQVELRLQASGARVERLPLPLDTLLSALVTR